MDRIGNGLVKISLKIRVGCFFCQNTKIFEKFSLLALYVVQSVLLYFLTTFYGVYYLSQNV